MPEFQPQTDPEAAVPTAEVAAYYADYPYQLERDAAEAVVDRLFHALAPSVELMVEDPARASRLLSEAAQRCDEAPLCHGREPRG